MSNFILFFINLGFEKISIIYLKLNLLFEYILSFKTAKNGSKINKIINIATIHINIKSAILYRFILYIIW